MNIHEFIQLEVDDQNVLLESHHSSNFESAVLRGIFKGVAQSEESNTIQCGHDYDCCGCLCNVQISYKKISRGKTMVTKIYSYNV